LGCLESKTGIFVVETGICVRDTSLCGDAIAALGAPNASAKKNRPKAVSWRGMGQPGVKSGLTPNVD